MSELKATPGPWETDSKDHDQPCLSYEIRPKSNQRKLICRVWQDDSPEPDYSAEKKANAHLIAAAPELFEALQKMVKMASTGMVDFNPHDEFVMSSACAALAKARGES